MLHIAVPNFFLQAVKSCFLICRLLEVELLISRSSEELFTDSESSGLFGRKFRIRTSNFVQRSVE